ncbi:MULTISPECIES: ABC transporter ATP-binding protein [Rhizobium]|uniref:ABC transporter ATP-binding protein n=1 Tax=Rhizobium rhododendri TaxID=2506430 RepID=A0ABY8IGB3_9HYPH|nr:MULTISPECIES: ABC transporter ATP-binding protein [Rhizobium]MBZ5760891.1 ABC transporter ATP-binding protein/permease [Rhizobium sp. VS19-DR96]MBZ5765325.1 ABC transporter ATP-binding protein/permease [Rhizobium sp. VS19-DR129.2]MBZ5774712.1 ABC transporter ATP-binding protein/permease [Rhizobium sp. VS19-DRK62.2]MBZ5784726.1 ABC transporter ATP-binding protein/permease [Rhizobium sp. VS19-DR121]MBZ5801338.1 ABC transporter ATP-binding protein/permease [Rhizobium sp. VS19-DR181]
MLRRFFSYYAPYKKLFYLDFGCAVVAGLLELGFPLAMKLFIDTLLPGQDWGLIAGVAVLLLVVYVINTGLMAVVNYWGHALGISIETDMRRQAFDHIQKLSFRFFDNNKTGHLIAHVTKDLEEVGEVAHHGPEDVFIAIMTFIGAFILMFTVHWKLALLTTVIVPVMTWMVSRYGARMTENWRKLFGQVGEFNARIGESVGGIRVVKAFANEDHERALFAVNNEGYKATKLNAYAYMTASLTLSYFGTRFVQLLVMVAGTYFVIRSELSYGGFVGFLLLVNVFFRPIDKITSVLESYPKGIAGFKRFTTLIDTAPDIADRPNAIAVEHLKGDIAYTDVSFGYDANGRILDRLNLTIRAGETIAFVGPSGAGKTTICSLLPRFYEVDSGAISIDGMDIRDMTQASLRAQIGIVAQDVFLFGGTIRDNIAYGRLGASDDEIMDALRRAALDEFVLSLPDGLSTRVGERGVKLSGGQKQRLAIARIFLKNPPILILDEATSALDTATEYAIQQSLAALSEGRTTLVVAHRLATIRNADRIIVVGTSGIVEDGTHQQLLARRGPYARLHEAQFGAVA